MRPIRLRIASRYRPAAVFAVILLPLLVGLAGYRPLLRNRTMAASERVRAERAAGVLAAVEAVREQARAGVAAFFPSGRVVTAAAVRQQLAALGWEPVPGIFVPEDGMAGVSRTFLEAVDREGVVTAFRFADPEPRLLVGVRTSAAGAGRPGEGTTPLVVATRPAHGPIARALGGDGHTGAGLYVDGRLLIVSAGPLGGLLPGELPEELVVEVIGEDRPRPCRTGSGDALLGALVPLKDFEAWDVIGLVLAGAPRRARPGVDASPGPGLTFLLLLLALLGAAAVAATARRAPGRSRLLALLALPPAVGGALLMRGHLQAAVGLVLESGPEPVREALAAGGLVERYTFGADLLILAALVLGVFFTALVLLTVWNLDHPCTLRATFTAYAFLSPAVIGLLLFFLGPMLFALYISFHQWSIVEPTRPFVGLANYAELVADADFRHALGTTFLYTLHVPVSMALALGLALLLNRPRRGVGLFRTLFFLPSITSFVAIAMVWEWIYNPDFGLANVALGLFGFRGSGWLTDPATALPALMLMAIWIGLGYQMVIFLAGLQGIPHTLYEAAIIDGAGPVRRFFRITLPLLKPTVFFVLVTSLIGSFQVFTQIYIMTDGGPVRATDVVVYHIYSAAWDEFRMGSASAMSWVLFVIIMLLTLLQFRLAGRETSYV